MIMRINGQRNAKFLKCESQIVLNLDFVMTEEKPSDRENGTGRGYFARRVKNL